MAPKEHYLIQHVPQHVAKWGETGLGGEQGVESWHQSVKEESVVMSRIRDPVIRTSRMLQRLFRDKKISQPNPVSVPSASNLSAKRGSLIIVNTSLYA